MSNAVAKILYMDDDPDVTALVQLKLEELGYEVHLAPDGIKGMEMLRADRYDLALIDFEMPGPDGLTIISDIIENGPDIPTIMISGVGNRRVVAHALRMGAADYVVKEIDDSYLEYLPISIERVLEKQRIITENRETHAALLESEQRYRDLIENNPLCIQEIDLEGRILSINQAGLNMLGRVNDQEVIGTDALSNISGDDAIVLQHALNAACDGKASHNLDIDASNSDEPHYLSVSLIPMRDKANRVEKIMSISADQTERKLFELKLIHMTQHDTLTDLPNRNLIYDHLGMTMARAERQKHQVAILDIDMDDFKKINDEYGYTTGDIVLMEAAKRLKTGIRESDIVARMGGDEMGIVLSDLEDKDGAERVAKDLIKRLSKPYQLGDLLIKVTCSIGIALYPDHGDAQEELIRKAEKAMNTAKRAGKHQYRFARKSA